jgi:hypothetical protein
VSCYTVTATSNCYTDYEGIYITIDSVDNDAKQLAATWHNESDFDATFGYWYTVEYKIGDEWRNVQIVDFAVPEIACTLNSASTSEKIYSLKYFNLWRKGTYRLRSELYLQIDEETSERVNLYTEFYVE